MEWINEFLGFLEKVFTPSTISRGFQRGFIFSAFVMCWLGVDMLLRCPPGSWWYYRYNAGKRIAESQAMADEVSQIEGKADGLAVQLNMLLKELEIRTGGALNPMPSPVAVSSSVSGVSVPPPVAPSIVPPMPPPPVAPLPPPPPLPTAG
jgi:hypothetical protein